MMPTTAARNSMKDRCNINRQVAGGSTDFGGPKEVGGRRVYSDLPCRGFETEETLTEDDHKVVGVATWKVRLPLDTEVKEGDTITGVADRDIEVLRSLKRRGHVLVLAREIA